MSWVFSRTRLAQRKNVGITHRPTKPILTQVEVLAIKEAASGGLSKASLARTYDVGIGVINHALKPGYYPREGS